MSPVCFKMTDNSLNILSCVETSQNKVKLYIKKVGLFRMFFFTREESDSIYFVLQIHGQSLTP